MRDDARLQLPIKKFWCGTQEGENMGANDTVVNNVTLRLVAVVSVTGDIFTKLNSTFAHHLLFSFS